MQRSSGFSVLRQTGRLLLALLLTLFCATLLLRLDAAIFEYRVLAVLRKMEGFKLGDTGQLELVDIVKRLQTHIVRHRLSRGKGESRKLRRARGRVPVHDERDRG